MKLPLVQQDVQEELAEFDIWITPSLGEIQDTDRFKDELELVSHAFEILRESTENFKSPSQCTPHRISETIVRQLSHVGKDKKERLLTALASILFLVTGKSDNNFKCQFPLYLRDVAKWDKLPCIRKRKGKIFIGDRSLPRTMKSEDYMLLISQIQDAAVASRLLERMLAFLLRDRKAVDQLWSIGYSYCALKSFGKSRDLLAPLVVFKVRGSVMASGGHEPEAILRTRLEEWGLQADVDFNLSDVVVGARESNDAKTRAFDFVLPYRTSGWDGDWRRRLFIQCQFYAGDSGSVSHKNVDQTRSSRDLVRREIDDARFVEYVDGAGYFSSLNGDLRRLLSFEDTETFFQIRSAPIRLRRELQKLGFLTILDVEHAIAATCGDDVPRVLEKWGFHRSDINRAIRNALDRKLITDGRGGKLEISAERRDISRRYALLDIVAIHGSKVDAESAAGKLLVPGYGPFYGIEMDKLAAVAIPEVPYFGPEINRSTVLLSDLRWLSENGFVLG